MTLQESIERRWKAEGYIPRHKSSSSARTLTLEWHSGKRCVLPWAQLIDAMLKDGDLLFSFVGREVAIYGLNLGGLLDAVGESRLEKVWELPADHQPTTNERRPCVTKIELCNWDCGTPIRSLRPPIGRS